MNNLEINPFSGERAKKLVIFLHGLGSDGADLLGLVPYFANVLSDCHFYSPNGIEECDMGQFGYQWFSLRSRDPNDIKKELDRVSPRVLDLIDNKLNELQLTYENLILIGFSQGTMLSLYLAYANNINVGAVVGFSGAFFPPEVIENKDTPVCLIHGTSDEVVSFSSLAHSEERLKKAGVKTVETFAIKNLGHSIDLSGLKFSSEFIKKYVR